MKPNSTRTIFYAPGANLAIAAAKTAGAIFTGSSAMLAEAIHSYADAGNQGRLGGIAIFGVHSCVVGPAIAAIFIAARDIVAESKARTFE